VGVAAFLFALFPLTDTDIWWHLACGREWVTTWTPVREPVVHAHQFFQQLVSFIYGVGGAPVLVVFKALLWGFVFALFSRQRNAVKISPDGLVLKIVGIVFLLFAFRYQLEFRPVVFSMLILGIFWNILPILFWSELPRRWLLAGSLCVLVLQWFWCKFQGLYILGPLFASAVFFMGSKKRSLFKGCFVVLLFVMPFLHEEGVLLAAYPFELLNRLLGLSPSATVFASEIAENRSPVTLLMEGENFWTSLLMLLSAVFGFVCAIRRLWQALKRKALDNRDEVLMAMVLLTTATLTFFAERNFVLFLPLFCAGLMRLPLSKLPEFFGSLRKQIAVVLLMFILGLWGRSLLAYDGSMIAFQRVPVAAAQWMVQHPHEGRLFNDDRAGGYLAFVNPADSIYIDGRFMLKTAEFFERYLRFAHDPGDFMRYADSVGIDRAVFPLRYYARWDDLIKSMIEETGRQEGKFRWRLAYRDEYFCVFDKARHF